MLIGSEILCICRTKRKYSENFHFEGSGAEFLHMGVIRQMSLLTVTQQSINQKQSYSHAQNTILEKHSFKNLDLSISIY